MPGMWDYLTLLPSLSLCLSLHLSAYPSLSLCVFLSSFCVSLYLYLCLFLSPLFSISIFLSPFSLSPLPIISRRVSLLLKTQVIIWAHLNNLGHLLHLNVLNLDRFEDLEGSFQVQKLSKLISMLELMMGLLLWRTWLLLKTGEDMDTGTFRNGKTVLFPILGTGWIV